MERGTSLEIAKSAEETFDAVELTRQLRSEVHRETEHLGRAELREYLHTHVKMPRYVSGDDTKASTGNRQGIYGAPSIR